MERAQNNLWLADVVQAFRELEEEPGRVVWLRNAYEWIARNRPTRPKNYDAVVRATIYHHSSDAEAFVPGNPDVFRKVAHGGWALRILKEKVPARSTDLFAFVLAQMSVDELTSFAGKGDALMAEVESRIKAVRVQFNMS